MAKRRKSGGSSQYWFGDNGESLPVCYLGTGPSSSGYLIPPTSKSTCPSTMNRQSKAYSSWNQADAFLDQACALYLKRMDFPRWDSVVDVASRSARSFSICAARMGFQLEV